MDISRQKLIMERRIKLQTQPGTTAEVQISLTCDRTYGEANMREKRIEERDENIER